MREQLLVKKVWFTAGSLQGSLAKKLSNHKKCFIFHSAVPDSSFQHMCLEEISLPADRDHCAGSPEGKGKQEGKKAIPDQIDDAETEFKLGSQADISGEAISWGMSLSEVLFREKAISWSSKWVGWLRKLSVLTAIRAEQWCQDSTIWNTVSLISQNSENDFYESQLTRETIGVSTCVWVICWFTEGSVWPGVFSKGDKRKCNRPKLLQNILAWRGFIPQPNSLFALDLALDLLSLIL